jgi:hypothetical protein
MAKTNKWQEIYLGSDLIGHIRELKNKKWSSRDWKGNVIGHFWYKSEAIQATRLVYEEMLRSLPPEAFEVKIHY